jgi:CrcB protein
MWKLLLIAAGGAAGTLARYATYVALARLSDRTAFAWGTLAVNVVGCFAMGWLQGLFADRWPLRPEYRLALTVGFLGGCTTFSSFGWDVFTYLRGNDYWRAAAYVVANNVLGVAMVFVGYAAARGGRAVE